MGGVGDGHPLLAALGLHGGDVEHKVRADDAGARLPGPHHPAVLPEGVTDTAHVQVLLRDFDLNMEYKDKIDLKGELSLSIFIDFNRKRYMVGYCSTTFDTIAWSRIWNN